jgi:hypothetical protein
MTGAELHQAVADLLDDRERQGFTRMVTNTVVISDVVAIVRGTTSGGGPEVARDEISAGRARGVRHG